MTVIKQVKDTTNIGLYSSAACFSEAPDFLQFNLIYGFNGSGKTTLSRLFETIGAGEIHKELPPKSKFKIQCADGSTIQENKNLDKLKGKILVFNVEFIKDNFSWETGTASSIAYLGVAMKDAATELQKVSKQQLAQELQTTINEKKLKGILKKQSDTNKQLAAKIKESGKLGHYTAANLKNDLVNLSIGSAEVVSKEDFEKSSKTLGLDSPKEKITSLKEYNEIGTLLKLAEETSAKEVKFELADDLAGWEEILSWIKEGIHIHKSNSLSQCKFCNNELTSARIATLEKSLDKSYELAVTEIESINSKLNDSIDKIIDSKKLFPRALDLYDEFKVESESLKPQIYITIESLSDALNKLISKLDMKKSDLGTTVDTSDLAANAANIFKTLQGHLKSLTKIINSHNEKSEKFDVERIEAIELVKKYLVINERGNLKQIKHEILNAETTCEKDIKVSAALVTKHADLQKTVRDEAKAADVVNAILSDYLGHNEISLVFVNEGYNIHRHGKPIVGSISDGEKTAISLCYFISKLNEDGKKAKSQIVVVDDPISSLDTKAQNYAFNLIKQHLGGAEQLFILTHNLHFMNECKKWLRNRETPRPRNGETKEPSARFYFLEAQHDTSLGRRTTRLRNLPKLLADYDSEYHFLFSQVYSASLQTGSGNLHTFYTLPNVMRKMLEIFFSFRFPISQDYASYFMQKPVRESGISPAKLFSLKRHSELESHSQSLDMITSLSSVNIQEVRDAASTAMELIAAVDPAHHKEMQKKCKK